VFLPFSLKEKSGLEEGKIMDYLFTVFGTLFFFGFSFFCLKKGDDWGGGALLPMAEKLKSFQKYWLNL